ncbi:MAG: MATE family efflux transporter [Bermanella sp.]
MLAQLRSQKNIYKTLWRLALPIMISNISLPLLGLVDTAILGHLDDNRYLAAVAMGASLLVFVLWSFAFLRMGTTALVAQQIGAQSRLKNSNHYQYSDISILHCALMLAGFIGLTLVLCSPLLIKIMLTLVAAVDDIEPLTQAYLQTRFLISPVTLMNYALLGYFIGQGKTKISLILLVSTNVLNGLLDYIFVYNLHLNSQGVAWASNLSECFQLILALYFVRNRILKLQGLNELKKYLASFISLNFHLFVRTFFLLFTFAFFMSKGAQHSAALLSANAILFNLLMFISNGLDGFALASESMVGKALGARNKKEIKQVIFASGFLSLVTAVVFTLVLAVSHQSILALLTSQTEVLLLLDQLIYWLIFLPIAGFACYWLDGIYIGLAAAKEMRNSLLFAVFILFLPLQYLFQNWALHGLWLAFYAFLIGRALWQLIKLPANINKSVNSATNSQ